MKSAFNKEVVRSIRQSAGRFFAILIISLLGAGFYAGLRMSAPDMRIAGDEFFDGCNLYDIGVMTTLGVDDESLSILREVQGVGEVMPAYRVDAMVQVGENSYAACVESLPLEAARESDTSSGERALSDDDAYLNRPLLVSGAWPNADNECVVGAHAADELGIAIGDSVQLTKTTGELDDAFSITDLTVVGLVNSPAYAQSDQLGPTTLGSGSLELYLYVSPAVFADDLPYAMAYLTVPAARDLQWESDAYDQAVAVVKGRVQDVADRLADARYDAVKADLHELLVGRIQELSVSLGWSDDIDYPEVFVTDRSKNSGAASLASDADGITQIATFLPFMFFLVAALVSLTSMTRMVDEERTDIGTHKALGYGRGPITAKYLIYGVLASGLGSVLGVLTLGKILPWFIMTSYQVSYAVPGTPTPIDPSVALRAIGLSVGVTAIATWGAAAASLRERPALLMLPRAPKAGKRIFLEHIRPLWSRMSFSRKVTARNLLRYKRRFFMAVVGIAGCTALLMVGFGIRDSIGAVVSNQFGSIVNYDAMVRVDDDITHDASEKVKAVLESDAVKDYVTADDFNLIAVGPDDDLRIEVVVPQDPNAFSEYVALRTRIGKDPLSLETGSIVLTEKASETLGLGVGDTVTLFDENDVGDATGEGRSFTVGGISENYLGHYAYMLPDVYHAAFDEEPEFGVYYVKLAANADAAAFSDELLAIDGVSTVSFVAEKAATYEDMLALMGKVIFVIILLSAALAFVVLYNLTNINIAERVREIATLKVLGFTRGEVSAYIFREIIVMALIGALIGCVLGVPLALYIAGAAETPQMMFGRIIEPPSYVLSFVITMVFSVIVAITMRPKLNQVDMVESLKSIE